MTAYTREQFLADTRAFRLSETGKFTADDVRTAHRRRIVAAHPDKPGGSTEKAMAVNCTRDRLMAWLDGGKLAWPSVEQRESDAEAAARAEARAAAARARAEEAAEKAARETMRAEARRAKAAAKAREEAIAEAAARLEREAKAKAEEIARREAEAAREREEAERRKREEARRQAMLVAQRRARKARTVRRLAFAAWVFVLAGGTIGMLRHSDAPVPTPPPVPAIAPVPVAPPVDTPDIERQDYGWSVTFDRLVNISVPDLAALRKGRDGDMIVSVLHPDRGFLSGLAVERVSGRVRPEWIAKVRVQARLAVVHDVEVMAGDGVSILSCSYDDGGGQFAV